jgi:hypothetical protein
MAAQKRLQPTVRPKPQVIDSSTDDPPDEEAKEIELPPITHLKIPEMRHTSTKIRWLLGMGYKVKEVSDFLGVRYQQVRNVGTTNPKRAAREDVPAYVVETLEIDDDLEAMDKHFLEIEMAQQRKQDRDARKRRNGGHEVIEDDDND